MAVDIKGTPKTKQPWYVYLVRELNAYGWIALILLILSLCYHFYNDIHRMALDQSAKQAETNLRIGILEGQMQVLSKNKKN